VSEPYGYNDPEVQKAVQETINRTTPTNEGSRFPSLSEMDLHVVNGLLSEAQRHLWEDMVSGARITSGVELISRLSQKVHELEEAMDSHECGGAE